MELSLKNQSKFIGFSSALKILSDILYVLAFRTRLRRVLHARPAGGPSLRSGSSLRSPALRAGSLRSRARYARIPTTRARFARH